MKVHRRRGVRVGFRVGPVVHWGQVQWYTGGRSKGQWYTGGGSSGTQEAGPRDSGIQGVGPGMVANRDIFVTPT